jgi:hypothetical protein
MIGFGVLILLLTPFSPWFALVAMALCCSACGISWPLMGRPTDQQLDQWYQEDLNALFPHGLKKLREKNGP